MDLKYDKRLKQYNEMPDFEKLGRGKVTPEGKKIYARKGADSNLNHSSTKARLGVKRRRIEVLNKRQGDLESNFKLA